MLKDIYFAYVMLGLVVVVSTGYAFRLATRGAAANARVDQIGGTALVGQGVMRTTYWAVDPFTHALVALGITANGATYLALAFGIGAGVAVGFEWYGLACMLATVSTLLDILDGQIARLTNTGSNFGELLDAAVDRYTEFAFLAGLALAYHDSLWLLSLVLAATLACFMVSYASAKAEAMQVKPPRGLMRRHERATYLIGAAGFTPIVGVYIHNRVPGLPSNILMIAALSAVAVIGNAAAVLRLVRIGRALR
jgi:CDP-diacylglycerol--glycerol-3-phosphate 3-phosphatidyltransferase